MFFRKAQAAHTRRQLNSPATMTRIPGDRPSASSVARTIIAHPGPGPVRVVPGKLVYELGMVTWSGMEPAWDVVTEAYSLDSPTAYVDGLALARRACKDVVDATDALLAMADAAQADFLAKRDLAVADAGVGAADRMQGLATGDHLFESVDRVDHPGIRPGMSAVGVGYTVVTASTLYRVTAHVSAVGRIEMTRRLFHSAPVWTPLSAPGTVDVSYTELALQLGNQPVRWDDGILSVGDDVTIPLPKDKLNTVLPHLR